ncbi:LacI family transcriptional regulator, partial [Escherichia coli]|nr:LacI family transcriptional regulator [Escherichia coli]
LLAKINDHGKPQGNLLFTPELLIRASTTGKEE